MRLRFTKYEWNFIILFIFLFPQSILTQVIDEFALSDEIFAICGLYVFLKHYSRKVVWRIYPTMKKIFILVFIIVFIGWYSSWINRIQPSFTVNLMDCFTFLKFFFIFFLGLWLLYRSNIERVITAIYTLVKLYLYIGFFFFLFSQMMDLGMIVDDRFIIGSYTFINSNPGDYASILIISLAFLHVYSYYTGKSCRLPTVLAIILVICTFRGKSLGFIATYFMIVFFIKKYNNLSFKTLASLGLLGLGGAFFQIRYYFLDNITPRSLFLSNGIITANNYFPFGAGFSTYGSNMAKVHYSPLYVQYGFNDIWGMNAEETMFLNDNFWPMVMGQYGWFGVILYVLLLILLFEIINKSIKPKQLKIAGFSLFFLLVYSSVGGPIFMHYIGCTTILIFSLVMATSKKQFKNDWKYV